MDKKRILIIEDDAVTQRFMTAAVEAEGYEAIVCSDGAEGLYRYATEDAFDAILLDLMMPRMNGFEFLEAMESLHEEGLLDEGVVIVNTCVDDYETLKRLAESVCIFSVRNKPIDRAKLVADLKAVISRQESLPYQARA